MAMHGRGETAVPSTTPLRPSPCKAIHHALSARSLATHAPHSPPPHRPPPVQRHRRVRAHINTNQ
eukprot:1543045-Prymnesium_polylepis.1